MAICNADQFLAESIESVLAQTFRDFELIIVDFGSTDNSRAITSGYAIKDARIKLLEIPNCGLAEARNAACSLARGKYIAVMDADDVCLPHRLMLEVDYLEKNPAIAIVGTATEWINAKGHVLGIHEVPYADHEIKATLPYRCPYWHPTVLIRKNAFLSVGGYRNAFVFAHDYDLELRLAERFACANLPDVVLRYRIHPSQVSFRKQSLQTCCKLAAQTSSVARKRGSPDPLNEITEITPVLLTELGVSKARQQNALVADFRNWVRSMIAAKEYAATQNAVSAMLRSDLRAVDRWQVADLYLTLALLYRGQANFKKTIVAAARAFLIYPPSIRHLFKKLMSPLQMSDEAAGSCRS